MSSTSSSYALYNYITLIFLLMVKASFATTFTLVNRCAYTVWPGILSNSGTSGSPPTGFELPPRAARSVQIEPVWSGRIWARTGCSFDPTTGLGRCETGDCGSNQVECNGAGAEPPATLAEFTVAGGGSPDFYDVSLVDGYNLPMAVQPAGGSGACGLTGCAADLNRGCPDELRAGGGQGCKSACRAFGSPVYCCSGAYGSPDTCRPSVYSEMFKNACPRSYSYAYDDATSTFTCSGADYTITFCPSLTSQKSSRDSSSSSTQSLLSPPAVENSGRSPAEDNDILSWLPDFGSKASLNYVFHSNYYIVICTATIFLSLPFLQL